MSTNESLDSLADAMDRSGARTLGEYLAEWWASLTPEQQGAAREAAERHRQELDEAEQCCVVCEAELNERTECSCDCAGCVRDFHCFGCCEVYECERPDENDDLW